MLMLVFMFVLVFVSRAYLGFALAAAAGRAHGDLLVA
jgi:hypothetical protein